MTNQKTIVYANTIDYDFDLQQRPHHLMNILANRGWKVYWVNNTKVEGKRKDIINENLEIWHNWDLFIKRVPEVDVYFSSWSNRYVDLDKIKSKVVVYDSLDNFEANETNELNMISKADILLTTSQPLYDIRKNQHNNIHICRNGCFPELGEKKYEEPKEFISIRQQTKKPIVLFSGALAYWCNLELIEKISQKYILVVVGREWGIKEKPKNILYLGCKKYEELQAYYQHCDVNILPFKRCQISDFSNPIKNYEGMTHGKITVATDIPEATIYPDSVFASKNNGEFLQNIEKALKLKNDIDTINKCKQNAKENSWHDRVDVIEKAINDYFRFSC